MYVNIKSNLISLSYESWVGRDGSVVISMYCFSERPQFDSQN